MYPFLSFSDTVFKRFLWYYSYNLSDLIVRFMRYRLFGFRDTSTVLQILRYRLWRFEVPFMRFWGTVLQSLRYRLWGFEVPFYRFWSTVSVYEVLSYRFTDFEIPFMRFSCYSATVSTIFVFTIEIDNILLYH